MSCVLLRVHTILMPMPLDRVATVHYIDRALYRPELKQPI